MIRKLFRDSTALSLSQIVANIAAFLMAWSIARGMGDAPYGIFAAAYALATALATVADSGVRLALIREVAREPGHWRGLLRYAVIVSFCLGAALAAIAVLVIVLREGLSDVQRLRIVLLGFALLWVEMRILTGVLSGRGLFVPVGVWTAAERIGGAVLIGALVFGLHAGLVTLAAGLCIWELAVVLALWRWMLRQGWPAGGVEMSAGRFLRLAIPFGLAGIASGVLSKFDLIVLGFQQAPAPVGYYAAGQTLSLLALFAVIALSSAMYPTLTEMARDGRHADARSLLMPALGTSMLMILSFASILIAGAPHWLAWIYGSTFTAGAPWLVLFAIAAVFPTLGSLFGSVVSAWGWQARWARVVLLALVVAAPLFWWAGRQWGIVGIASCAVLAQLGPALVLWRWLCRAELVDDRWWLAKVMLVQLAMGAAVAACGIGNPLLWLLPLAVPAALIAGGICRKAWVSRLLGLLASGRRTA